MLTGIKALLPLLISALALASEGNWFTDFDRGMSKARAEGKDMIIYFYSDHCPYCWQMEEFVLGDPEIDRYINERYVFVSISVEDVPLEVDKKFNPIGTPYFVFYDPAQEKVLFEVFGSREREDFLNLLIQACKRSKINLRRC